MSAPAEQEAAGLGYELAQIVGVQAVDFLISRDGEAVFLPIMRVVALGLVRDYLPGAFARASISVDDAALESGVAVAMQSFDRRVAELKAKTTTGGTA